jgi:hypothetical protein
MTIAINILFWVFVIAAVWAVAYYWRAAPWPIVSMLLLACVILLGIATFGGLHLVR